MGSIIFLLYFACLVLRYPDVEENPGPRGSTSPRCRVMFSNINGLHGNLAELSVVSSRYDVVVCAETKATQFRHPAELLLPGFCSPVLLPRGARPNGLGLALYVRAGYSASRQMKYECSCCEVMVVKLSGARANFYVTFVYRSPSTDTRVFDCLLESMGKIQSEDPKSVFLFIGDFNCHHSDWLGSFRTDPPGIAAHNFASLSDCSQLVQGATHRAGGVLDLVLTNVPDLCNVVIGGPIGRSDHNHIGLTVNTSARAPSFDCSSEVLLKTRVNWDTVRERVSQFPWSHICRSDTMVDDLDAEFARVVDRYVPKVTLRRRFGDKPWFDAPCRAGFDRKQTAYFQWCRSRSREDLDLFRRAQRDANACYEDARVRYSEQCLNKLTSASSAHSWWSTLKESVLGVNASIPPLQSLGGALVSDPAGKAELLSTHFDGKQSRESVALPLTCHPHSRLCNFAFRSREIKQLLLELDAYGGVDPLGFFPLFFRELASVIPAKLSTVFRRLLREGCFPSQWCCANVTPVPKGPVSSLPAGFRPISITPVLSKVFERLLASRLGVFMEKSDIFSKHQYAYRKGLGTCDALLDVVGSGQVALDRGSEMALVQIDFSAAFDRVNHAGLLFKLQSVGVGGVFLRVIHGFLSGRSQRVKVDGASSRPVGVVSGVPQGSVLGPLLFLLYTSDLSDALENVLVGYADDSTLIATVPRPSDRISVVSSLNRDLIRIGEWCSAWGMLVNPSKTKAMVISRSRTIAPPYPDLVLNGTVIDMVKELRVLGVVLDSKLTFESHVRCVAAAASRKLGILRKTIGLYRLPILAARCFWSFLLPVLEYCSAVWMSAAATHLHLLDRVVARASTLSGGEVRCDLGHRRKVAAMCMFYKIWSNNSHPVREFIPPIHVPGRRTRQAANMHALTLEVPRAKTHQFSRTFVPCCTGLWNS